GRVSESKLGQASPMRWVFVAVWLCVFSTSAVAAKMSDPDKPQTQAQVPDVHLREETIDSSQVYKGHFIESRRDRVRLPDGREAPREYVVHPGAVMIVAMSPDGKSVMERQYRYPVRQTMIEFPAGKSDAGEGGSA
ncbi:hypothetical protein OY671_011565, partial [Metschnikowia pulcherrima]